MANGFEKKVGIFCKANGLLCGSGNVLVAVSGGADSIALLSVMCGLKKAGMVGGEIIACHINHNLRGKESQKDAELVAETAKAKSIPLKTISVDVSGFAKTNKLSIETAARQVRLDALIEMAAESECIAIATGHHKDDNAETMVHRIVRGTGFRGLGGIWPKRKAAEGIEFIRPLLCAGREEVLSYCEEKNLNWRKDSSNDDIRFTRNRIRHLLLPELEKQSAGRLADKLMDLSSSSGRLLSRICQRADDVWGDIVLEASGSEVVLDREGFGRLSRVVAVEIARRALVSIGSGEQDLTSGHYDGIVGLADGGRGGRKLELPGGFEVVAEYGKIIFSHSKGPKEVVAGGGVSLPVPGEVEFGDFTIKTEVLDAGKCDIAQFRAAKDRFIEWFDIDRIAGPLTVRSRKEGDKFRPMGFVKNKKIGKFLTAQRISSEIRLKIAIIEDGEKIIWLGPVRPCEQTKIVVGTRQILQIRLKCR
jgi:tRNA(Ile)-lysidine synthase